MFFLDNLPQKICLYIDIGVLFYVFLCCANFVSFCPMYICFRSIWITFIPSDRNTVNKLATKVYKTLKIKAIELSYILGSLVFNNYQ